MMLAVLVRYLIAAAVMSSPVLVREWSPLILILNGVVAIKFLIYEGVTEVVKKVFREPVTQPWFWIGYALCLLLDVFFVNATIQDEADSGFAYFGTILFTPWVLVAALVVMALAAWWRSRAG